MVRRFRRWLLAGAIVACLIVQTLSAHAQRVEILVSAAASTSDVMRVIARAFEQKHPGVTVRFNFGSSGALRRQIERGAPVDLFLSASDSDIAALHKQGIVASEGIRSVASNRIVLITRAEGGSHEPKGRRIEWSELSTPRYLRIAIGNPLHVPAGIVAQRVLERMGILTHLDHKFILGEDVRQVLRYVETGAVDAGFVYATDAAGAERDLIVSEAPPWNEAFTQYQAALIIGREHAATQALLEYLVSPESQENFSRFGFEKATL